MAKIVINADSKKGTINKNIYGHFSEHLGRCIYEGIWVGKDSPIPNTDGMRNDVINALKDMKIPLLRWPGGCFADEYHWMDGIGKYEERPMMINTHWGGVVENNHFGTHEFMRLCELIEAEPYICGNLGSGTVQEMQQWVEYMTFDGDSPMSRMRKENGRELPWSLTYFGIGNENWGCGGNMRPQYYADEYKRYATYVRNFGGNKISKIACGPNGDNYEWTEVLMREAKDHMYGLSLHHYTITFDWQHKGSASVFDDAQWFRTLKQTLTMEDLITKHSVIMDKYDPEKKVALIVDEWGTWFDVEPGTNPGFLFQQNTLRDALVAGINLNIFNNHCDRVKMANIAQVINVLQAVIFTEGEKMVLTPTYHVFEMFKVHQDAELVSLAVDSEKYVFGEEEIEMVNASASIDCEGNMNVSICNLHHSENCPIEIDLRGQGFKAVAGKILTSDKIDACNTFDAPEAIKPIDFNGAKLEGSKLTLTLPAKSVVVLKLN